jgi:anti-sigma factor RsiW
MNCADCVALISSFLDHTLPPPDREQALSHLETCATCRLHLHQALNARGYITCRQVVDLVSAYLEEELPAEERIRFEQHLAICPPCRVYVDQMRQTIQALVPLSEESLSEVVKLDLLLAFRNWTNSPVAAPESPDRIGSD